MAALLACGIALGGGGPGDALAADSPGWSVARTARLMFDTVLPNCAAPLIVQATLGFSSAILDAAALGFLGLGAQPPTPEWGKMVSDGRAYLMEAPHVSMFPGLAIFVAVMGFNCLGDGLRDALDPRVGRVAVE